MVRISGLASARVVSLLVRPRPRLTRWPGFVPRERGPLMDPSNHPQRQPKPLTSALKCPSVVSPRYLASRHQFGCGWHLRRMPSTSRRAMRSCSMQAACGEERPDHRRAFANGGHPSRRPDRERRSAVRLLPVGQIMDAAALLARRRSRRMRYRRGDEIRHLPLRDLPGHSRGDPSRGRNSGQGGVG